MAGTASITTETANLEFARNRRVAPRRKNGGFGQKETFTPWPPNDGIGQEPPGTEPSLNHPWRTLPAPLIGINGTASPNPPKIAPPPNPRDTTRMSFRSVYRQGFARVAARTARPPRRPRTYPVPPRCRKSSSMAARRVRFMRLRCPGPCASNHATTSASIRSVFRTLRGL